MRGSNERVGVPLGPPGDFRKRRGPIKGRDCWGQSTWMAYDFTLTGFEALPESKALVDPLSFITDLVAIMNATFVTLQKNWGNAGARQTPNKHRCVRCSWCYMTE